MRTRLLVIMLLTALLPAEAVAQAGGGRVAIGVRTGGTAFSDLQRRSAFYAGAAGSEIRTFDEAIAAEPTLVAGGSVSVWPRDSWGIRLQYSATRSNLRTYAIDIRGENDEAGPGVSRDLSADFYTTELLFRLPLRVKRVSTFGAVGGGVIRYTANTDSGDAALPPRTRAAAVFGLGARVPMRDNRLDLEFELTDHIARAPWRASELETGAELLGTDRQQGVREVLVVNHVRVTVGFRYSIHVWRQEGS